jgi:hypothetical protein
MWTCSASFICLSGNLTIFLQACQPVGGLPPIIVTLLAGQYALMTRFFSGKHFVSLEDYADFFPPEVV